MGSEMCIRDREITAGQIDLIDVGFTYADGTQALSALTLTAAAGKTTALVGPSGGGKSTIMHLIPRLYDVSDGSVRIDGQDVREISQASLRKQIAVVSQEAVLFNDTIAANIGLGDLSATRAAITQAAKSADAHGFISALPDGLRHGFRRRRRRSIRRAKAKALHCPRHFTRRPYPVAR